jgi:hypothetical protein
LLKNPNAPLLKFENISKKTSIKCHRCPNVISLVIEPKPKNYLFNAPMPYFENLCKKEGRQYLFNAPLLYSENLCLEKKRLYYLSDVP